MSIFVSIAAYRDPDLNRTLADCVSRARDPGQLRFGICWQHAEGEPPPVVPPPATLRLIDVPWQESQGTCWARAEAMRLWQGEAFYLQLDSHHRFVQDWDTILLNQLERSDAERPLLTAYLPGFDPDGALPATEAPTCMTLHRFSADGIPRYDTRPQPDWVTRTAPVRARFVSAHLLFTLGRFVDDVPYDPGLYFHGEEIMLAIRAFTHGYTLLHPAVHVAWHEYTRRQRIMHWTDHVAGRGVVTTWQQRDTPSRATVRQFLTVPWTGRFGCGDARGFSEYETYAGVNFARRAASAAARRGDEPAAPPPPGKLLQDPCDWQVRIALDRAALPADALDRPAFWYVGFHDETGHEVARADANPIELHRILAAGGTHVVIERQFRSARPPARWTIQPTDRRRVWLAPLSGPVYPRAAGPGPTT